VGAAGARLTFRQFRACCPASYRRVTTLSPAVQARFKARPTIGLSSPRNSHTHGCRWRCSALGAATDNNAGIRVTNPAQSSPQRRRRETTLVPPSPAPAAAAIPPLAAASKQAVSISTPREALGGGRASPSEPKRASVCLLAWPLPRRCGRRRACARPRQRRL
jgi:hypothetical protein